MTWSPASPPKSSATSNWSPRPSTCSRTAASRTRRTPDDSPLTKLNGGNGLRHHFLNNGNSALAADAQAAPWRGDYVFNSGNLVLDMLHNFFLESGARMGKLRVYESSTNPVVKRLTGYLLCRGGVHQLAYAVALSKLTGVEVEKMLPIPDIRTDKIPECREFIAKNLHNTLYRFSPDDYKHIGDVFNGTHPGRRLAPDGARRDAGRPPAGRPEARARRAASPASIWARSRRSPIVS